jgi:hypothetical protein
MRKVVRATVTMAGGIALLSCTAPQPSAVPPATTPMANESSGPVVRTPLSPPVGFASPAFAPNSPTPLEPYASSPDDGAYAQTGAGGAWRASPRWSAVKGDGCIEVDQYPQAKVATQAEAAKARIENCSKEDADELMPAQPEDLNR